MRYRATTGQPRTTARPTQDLNVSISDLATSPWTTVRGYDVEPTGPAVGPIAGRPPNSTTQGFGLLPRRSGIQPPTTTPAMLLYHSMIDSPLSPFTPAMSTVIESEDLINVAEESEENNHPVLGGLGIPGSVMTHGTQAFAPQVQRSGLSSPVQHTLRIDHDTEEEAADAVEQ